MIRILKLVAGDRGVFHPGGEHAFDDAYEAGLVAAGAAEYVGAPPKPEAPVERAVAPEPEEAADAPPARRGRRK